MPRRPSSVLASLAPVAKTPKEDPEPVDEVENHVDEVENPVDEENPVDVENPVDENPAEEEKTPISEVEDIDEDDLEPIVEHYSRVDVRDLFSELDMFLPMEKIDGLYVVPFAFPIRVQTPALKLSEDLVLDSRATTTATFETSGSFRRFAQKTESAVLEAAIANKRKWFKKDMSESALQHSFKTFLTDKKLRVKVDEDVELFDRRGRPVHVEDGVLKKGSEVRCILELSAVFFGRKEFGSMWGVLQVQLAEGIKKCLFDLTSEIRGKGMDAIAQEFS